PAQGDLPPAPPTKTRDHSSGRLRGHARDALGRRRGDLAAVDDPAGGRAARQAGTRLSAGRGRSGENRDIQHGQVGALPRFLRARRVPAVSSPRGPRRRLPRAPRGGRAPGHRCPSSPAVRALRRAGRALVRRTAGRADPGPRIRFVVRRETREMMDPLTIARRIYRRLRPAQDHWTHFLSILDRRTLEHDAALDAAAKRALFKRNVDLVELEPHAYCNRTCSFCPNATIDRL